MNKIVILLCARTTFIVFFTNSDPAETNMLFWKGICRVKNGRSLPKVAPFWTTRLCWWQNGQSSHIFHALESFWWSRRLINTLRKRFTSSILSLEASNIDSSLEKCSFSKQHLRDQQQRAWSVVWRPIWRSNILIQTFRNRLCIDHWVAEASEKAASCLQKSVVASRENSVLACLFWSSSTLWSLPFHI